MRICLVLFTCDKLKFYDDDRLKLCCSRLEAALKNGNRSYINANELYVELRSLNSYFPTENMRRVDVLNFLKQDDCYPNAIIAYRVLLTFLGRKKLLKTEIVKVILAVNNVTKKAKWISIDSY